MAIQGGISTSLLEAVTSYSPLAPGTMPGRPSGKGGRRGFHASLAQNDPVRRYLKSMGGTQALNDGWIEVNSNSRELVWQICEGHPKVENVLSKLWADVTNGGLDLEIEEAGAKRVLSEMVKAGVIATDYEETLTRDIIKHAYFSGYVLLSVDGDSAVMPKTKVPVVISRSQYSVLMRNTGKGREYKIISTEGVASGIGGAHFVSSTKGSSSLTGSEYPYFKNMAGMRKQMFYCPYPPTDDGFVDSPLSKVIVNLLQLNYLGDDSGYASFWRAHRGVVYAYQPNQKDSAEAWEDGVFSRSDADKILEEHRRSGESQAREELLEAAAMSARQSIGIAGNGGGQSSGRRVMAQKEAVARGLASGIEASLGTLSQYPNAHAMYPPEEHAMYLGANQTVEPAAVPEVMPEYVNRLHQLTAEFYTDLGMPPALMNTESTNFAGDAALVLKNYGLKIRNLQRTLSHIIADAVSVIWRRDFYKNLVKTRFNQRFKTPKSKKAKPAGDEEPKSPRPLPPPGISSAFLTGSSTKETPETVGESTNDEYAEQEAERRLRDSHKLALMHQISEASTIKPLKKRGRVTYEDDVEVVPSHISAIEDPWDGGSQEYLSLLKKALNEGMLSVPAYNADGTLVAQPTKDAIAKQKLAKKKVRTRATKEVLSIVINAIFNNSPDIDQASLLNLFQTGVISQDVYNEHAGRMAGLPPSQINTAAQSKAQSQEQFDTTMQQSESQMKLQKKFAEPAGTGADGKSKGVKLAPLPPAASQPKQGSAPAGKK